MPPASREAGARAPHGPVFQARAHGVRPGAVHVQGLDPAVAGPDEGHARQGEEAGHGRLGDRSTGR